MVATATDPFPSSSSANSRRPAWQQQQQELEQYKHHGTPDDKYIFPHKNSSSLPPSSSSSSSSSPFPVPAPNSTSVSVSVSSKKKPPAREISSRYRSPAPPSEVHVSSRYRSPPPHPHPHPHPHPRPSPSPSPSTSTSTSISTAAARRFTSPSTAARNSSGIDQHLNSSSIKRSISAERLRRASPPPPLPSSRTSTAANSCAAVIGDGGGGSRVSIASSSSSSSSSTSSSRQDLLLWPSTRNLPLSSSSSSSSMQAVAEACTPTTQTQTQTQTQTPRPSLPASSRSPGRGRPQSRSHSTTRSLSNLASDQTLKPPPNSAPTPMPTAPGATSQIRPYDMRKKTPDRKGMNISPSPLRGRRQSLVDQAENAKPSADSSLTEPVLRHRWPSSTNLTNRSLKLSHGSSASMSLSMDLTSTAQDQRSSSRSSASSSHHYMLQSRPTSFSSQVIPRVFSHTVNNDGSASSALRSAARKLSLEAKPRVSASSRESPLRRGTNGNPLSHHVREMGNTNSRVNAWPHAERPSSSSEEPSSSSSLSSSLPLDDMLMNVSTVDSSCSRAQPSSSRVVQKLISASSLDNARGEQSMADSPASSSSWLATPTNSSLYKPSYNQLLSPMRLLHSSPMRSWSSPTRSRVSTHSLGRISWGSSILQFGGDFRRSKRNLSHVEAAYLHRILHNRLLQWRFVNARADHANMTQRHAGEKLIFSVWARTAEIRKSVTTKRLKLQQARQARKINSVLRTQGSKLEYWSTIQQEHSKALSGAVEALEAAVLRLPVDEGVKAETQSVKEAMASAVEVVNAVESSINLLLPKVDKSNVLISELAQIADQERTLLEECGDLLLIVSSLEVEERSLRMQLLQCEQEKARVLGLLMDGNGTDSGPM